MFLLLFFVAGTLQLASSTEFSSPYICIDSNGLISECTSQPDVDFANRPSIVAHARFVNNINKTGWAELDIHTNGPNHHEDHVQAFFAGFLEGYLTAHLMDSFRENVQLGKWGDRDNRMCKDMSSFIEDNLNWTMQHLREGESEDEDIYWQQVGLVLHQLAGLDTGYLVANKKVDQLPIKPHLKLDPCGTILTNLFAEVGDLEEIINPGSSDSIPEEDKMMSMDHCSALIKWLPEKGEVYVSQNTWTMYSMMLRVLKKYTLNYRSVLQSSGARSVVLSSYPGALVSFDDFYITSNDLVVQETSIENFRPENYHGMNARNMVFEFIRNTVANRLAKTGKEWAHWFAQHNSGTYNNQFMIVDYKRLKHEGKHLEDDFLTILEQMPHLIWVEDRTYHVREHSYWASYNIPAFTVIYEYSGTGDQFKKYGDYYSYEKTSRAQIFARDHVKVTNLTTMYHLMRYNDFQHDPLSKCDICVPEEPNGIYAIAARGDLNDPNAKSPLYQLNYHMLGAIDAKVTSATMAHRLEFVAVSGPTDQQEGVFDWSKIAPRNQLPHADQPNVWHFKPMHVKWNRNGGEEDKSQELAEFEEFKFDL